MHNTLQRLQGGVIISCQAAPTDPTYGPAYMVAFARAAARGGAVGIRANGVRDVAAIKEEIDLPLIALWKRPATDGCAHMITPTVADARALRAAGGDVIAVEATNRPRPGGLDAPTLIRRIREEVGVSVMADCATVAQASAAQEAGAALVGTTLGLPPSLGRYTPNLTLLQELVDHLAVPVVAEGHYWDPADVQRAFDLGAWAVVIGTAVTRPWTITERFVQASPRGTAAPTRSDVGRALWERYRG
jgi:putative N-acetylmannosamine-6-phosphate epimerase